MNNNKIFEKVKIKIAISNVKEEDIAMNKNKLNLCKSIGIAACIILSMTGVVFATTKVLREFGFNSSDGVQKAVENGYYSKVDSEYKEANGISTSIESFLIDDYNFDINIKIKFNDKYNLKNMLSANKNIDIMDLQVINEKGETVFSTHELETKENINLFKTKEEFDNDTKCYKGGYSSDTKIMNDNEIIYILTASGNPVKFPESQKLKVTFNKIRNTELIVNENEEPFWKEVIYEGKWEHEIAVPNKMAKSNIVMYKLVSISDENYKFENATLSNTAFRIYLSNCNGIIWDDRQCVETSNGTKFYPALRSDGDGEISILEDGIVRYYQTFNLTNYDATDRLKVHLFKSTGEEIIIELEKDN